ncbi:hypothetical protein HPB49_011606 [Dermacentor silvarum]|uniref:Uncharacterized protein n=1 Tax=Dermacentor silvarum TaxID=543639 RepID=A0ACB8DCQ0_DERSI|nr:hypothetical protein HPB49_011606 [Dermacentor silvarum]
MYASVRFRDDDAREVVSVDEIKHFSPQGISDYHSDKWYKVHWKDDCQDGFFRAQILRLFETKEAARQPARRVPLPPRPSDSESEVSMSSADSLQEVFRKAAKGCAARKSEGAFQRGHLKSLIAENDNMPDLEEELAQLRSENRSLRAENRNLLHANKKLHSRVEMLEKALCSKIFETESHILSIMGQNSTGAVAPVTQLQKPQQVAAGPQKPQKVAAGPLLCLPRANEVPDGISATPAVETNFPPSCTSEEIGSAVQPLVTVPTITVVGDKVLFGIGGVCLAKAAYDHLMQRPKDGIFVREACVQIFSTAGLMGKSVTGAASNRTKGEAKPALDAFKHYLEQRCSSADELVKRHNMLGKLVAGKIADLMKKKKEPIFNEDFDTFVDITADSVIHNKARIKIKEKSQVIKDPTLVHYLSTITFEGPLLDTKSFAVCLEELRIEDSLLAAIATLLALYWAFNIAFVKKGQKSHDLWCRLIQVDSGIPATPLVRVSHSLLTK